MTNRAQIADILGGRRVLQTRPRNAAEWLEVARQGVPFESAASLKRWLAVGDDILAQLLGISTKTLSRARASSARLDPVVSDRLLRVARISALACEVLENEERARLA